MDAAVDLSFLQDSNAVLQRRIRILRSALLSAKSQLCVTQIENPNLVGNDNVEMMIDWIQRAMRYEEDWNMVR